MIDSRVSEAERALVRVALKRGFLSTSQLRHALLLQNELIRSGQPSPLLPLLREHLPPERLPELREVYQRFQSGSRDSSPPHDTQVAVPDHVIQSTLSRVSLPRERDPGVVRETLGALLSNTSHASTERDASETNPAARLMGRVAEKVEQAREPAARLGPYELREELGRGGMGAVYRAHHPGMGRDVAIKVLLAGDLASDRQRERFDREVRTAARLRHPNIVAVHDVGVDDGRPYLVMELIEGEALERVIERRGPLPQRDLALLGEKLARALHFAHERGVVHRDVKPANVIVARGGEPLITDFGLARDTEAALGLTRSGQFLGTPIFAPPEQIKGQGNKADARSDVYSLGATLYQALTGEHPFMAATRLALDQQIVDRLPDAPSEKLRGVDPALDAILLKCLAKDREDRYQTAAALADDLRRYLDDLPIHACPPPTGARLRLWTRRNRVAVLAAGGTALLAALLAVPWALTRRELDERDWNDLGVLREAQGDADAAREAFDKALEKNPRQVASLIGRANAKADKGDLRGALEDLNAAIRLTPKDALALSNRGLLKKKLGDLPGAIADYTRAIEAAPRQAAAYNNRGNALSDLGELLKARADLDRALEIDPQYSQAYSNRGIVRARSGDPDGAMRDYDRALGWDPDNARALANRGAQLWERKRYAEARVDLDRAVALDPDYAMAWNNRGNVSFAEKDYAGAIRDYTRALDLNPRLAMAWSNRGSARVTRGEVQGALDDFSAAIELEFTLAYLLRGLNRADAGDRAGAITDLRAFLETSPKGQHEAMARAKLKTLGE